MSKSKTEILLVNGSRSGNEGNSHLLLELCAGHLRERGASITNITLAKPWQPDDVRAAFDRCDGAIFGTGTYWDSWSTHLQHFFEVASDWEGTSPFLGKPVGCVVSMHSVGGKEVLSRLQGVLNVLGMAIPPMSGMVYSYVNHKALQAKSSGTDLEALTHDAFRDDIWCPEDLEVVAHNVFEMARGTRARISWPVDRNGFRGRWFDGGDGAS